MSDAFILRSGGGGGLSPNSAVIHVTAPVRSTISFTKGGVVTKVLGPEKSHVSADDTTLAEWYYAISSRNYGTWTVTATLGDNTSSETVVVDSAKEYSLEITYNYWIFKSGIGEVIESSTAKQQNSSITVGTDSIVCSYSSTSYAQVVYWTTSKINLALYSSFHVVAKVTNCRNDDGYYPIAFVASSTPSAAEMNTEAKYVNKAALDRTGATVDTSLDLTDVYSTSYVGFRGTFIGIVTGVYLK